MKKDIINDIDKMKEERKLPKEIEQKIFTRAIYNWGIAVLIITLILVLNFTIVSLPKTVATDICNACAMGFLIFSIVITEIGYKKNKGKWAIIAIEMIVVSIFTLFASQIFLQNNYKIIHIFIAITAFYYSLKIIGIYYVEKRKYLTEISDITNIIKKESNDNLAEQEKEKRKKELRKLLEEEQNKETKPKRKPRTTKKKEIEPDAEPDKKKTTTKKTTSKKSTTANKEKKTTKKSETTQKEDKTPTKPKITKKSNTKPKETKTEKKSSTEPKETKTAKKSSTESKETKTTKKSSTASKATAKRTSKTTKKESKQGE